MSGDAAEKLRPRLWVVSELYYPEDVSTGHFLTGIAEGLAEPFDVHVVCSQPSYSKRGERAPSEEVRHGVHIVRKTPPLFDKNILPLRLLTSLFVTVSIGTALFRRLKRADHVLVVTNPFTLPYVVALICRMRGAQYTLLVHDVYPDVLTAVGMVKQGGLVDAILSHTVRWLYDGAQCVVVLGRDMERNISARISDASRIRIIPNWGDGDVIGATPLAQDGPFVVQYLGNMGRTHDLSTLVGAAKLTQGEPIRWMFVGDGANRKIVEAALTDPASSNIVLMNRVAADQLADTLTQGHVSVIAFVAGMAGISVPSRVYNAMCAGRPILLVADDDSEVAHLVRDHGIGWVVKPGDAVSLAATVRRLAGDRGCVADAGTAARRLAEASYTRPAVVGQYRAMFETLVGGSADGGAQ